MFQLLETKVDIAHAQRSLMETLRAELSRTIRRDIGYPGGTEFNLTVHTDGHYWFRTGQHDGTGTRLRPRYLNWFGVLTEGALQITVECNPPRSGINAALAGYFARDPASGQIYLMHSGRVGGGTRVVGRDAFLAWSDARLTEATDSAGRVRRGVVVLPVAARAASASLTRYIDQIAAFKAAVRAGDLATPAFEHKLKQYRDHYAEPRGRRRAARQSYDYESRHGDVVDALNSWRLARGLSMNQRIVKNVLIDLGVAAGSQLVEAYEVKTSADRQAAYAAIGQLLVHGPADGCQRTVVLPSDEQLPSDITAALGRLNIDVLRFRLGDRDATIV